MNVAAQHVSLLLAVHPAAAEQTGPAHAALYETCAGLIVAVLVVLYFDERVRRGLTARMRGYAIGSLGGFVGVGLLTPVFALAGIIGDTRSIRWFTAVYTLAFLTFAFGIAIQNWGYEDGARMRAAQAPPPVAVAPVPVPPPREGQTEREHAAEVLGAALVILGQVQPDAVTMCLAKAGPAREHERLRQLSTQWMTIQPALIAISAGYPSAGVRERTAAFAQAVSGAVAQPATPLRRQGRSRRREASPGMAGASRSRLRHRRAGIRRGNRAFHADDPPAPKPAVNGRRPRRTRTSTETGAGAGS